MRLHGGERTYSRIVSHAVVSAWALSFATPATFAAPVASIISQASLPMFSPVGRVTPALVARKKDVYCEKGAATEERNETAP